MNDRCSADAPAPTFIEESLEDEDGVMHNIDVANTVVRINKGVMQVECGNEAVFGYVNTLTGKLTLQEGYMYVSHPALHS